MKRKQAAGFPQKGLNERTEVGVSQGGSGHDENVGTDR